MKRLTPVSVLLLAGGVLVTAGLPLQWSSLSFPEAATHVQRGLDYPGYDIVTTLALGLLLIVAAFALAAGRRWGHHIGVTAALLTCMWAALVVAAAANPIVGGTVTGVTVSVGLGAYLVAAGAALALFGAVLSFAGRSLGAEPSGATSSMDRGRTAPGRG